MTRASDAGTEPEGRAVVTDQTERKDVSRGLACLER